MAPTAGGTECLQASCSDYSVALPEHLTPEGPWLVHRCGPSRASAARPVSALSPLSTAATAFILQVVNPPARAGVFLRTARRRCAHAA